jgi:hypothetical protein
LRTAGGTMKQHPQGSCNWVRVDMWPPVIGQ